MVISDLVQSQLFKTTGECDVQLIRIPPTRSNPRDIPTHDKDILLSTKPSRLGPGLWLHEEHERFLEGLNLFPSGPWKLIAAHVRTKTARQVMTHAQKYRQKIARRERGLRTRSKRSASVESVSSQFKGMNMVHVEADFDPLGDVDLDVALDLTEFISELLLMGEQEHSEVLDTTWAPQSAPEATLEHFESEEISRFAQSEPTPANYYYDFQDKQSFFQPESAYFECSAISQEDKLLLLPSTPDVDPATIASSSDNTFVYFDTPQPASGVMTCEQALMDEEEFDMDMMFEDQAESALWTDFNG